jgi:hypothetical protein
MRVSQVVLAAAAAIGLAAAQPTVAHAQVGAEVTINIGPPAAKVEVIPASPGGSEYVWEKGEWVWSPERTEYVWHPGHWVMHPMGFEVWASGQWVLFEGAWRYLPGHWRSAREPAPPDPIKMVQVTLQPPEPRVEVIPPRASPAYAWNHGHWAWTGLEYRWVPGHWAFVPAGFHEWVRGHWYHHGTYWFFASGYWR